MPKVDIKEGDSFELAMRRFKRQIEHMEGYGAKIPEDAFLVLGNLVEGSIDSTAFGLVSRDDIIGKVEIK